MNKEALLQNAAKLALERMKGARIFVNSKEKIKQPEGAEWFEEGVKALEEALAKQEEQTDCDKQGETVGDLAEYVIGCFRAAEFEGLQEALAETTDERLKDLVERRLMHAFYKAQEPQQRTWVGLTDEQTHKAMHAFLIAKEQKMGLGSCIKASIKAAYDIKENT
jgi:hypothetical protein